jgi:cyclohexa-1,5-dienecarbonyl-CoA hydratase
MTDGYKDIRLERDGGVATLTLAKAPLNVLDIAMMEEMNRALYELEGDPSLKVLVIMAEGKAFSAGVDISDHTADKVEDMIRVFHEIFHHMSHIHAPIVAVVDGAALGGGCEVVLFADIVLASERSKFGQPEIQVGVFPPLAAVMLPHLTGRQKALELVLTGAVIKANEALRIGIVNQVFPVEGFDEAVEGYLAQLAGLSAPVLQLTKRAVVESMGKPFTDAMRVVEHIYLGELMETEDANEGLASFMEKRKPVWRDK